MKSYTLDSYALLAYFQNEEAADVVEKILVDIVSGKATGRMSALNIGEVHYMMVRKKGLQAAENAVRDLTELPIEIVPAGTDAALRAARLKARYKMSYADAFLVDLTISTKSYAVSGDPELIALKDLPGFRLVILPQKPKKK